MTCVTIRKPRVFAASAADDLRKRRSGAYIYYNTVQYLQAGRLFHEKESISMTVCPDGAKARLANHHLRG